MAQTGYSPISLYYSTTASAAPTAGNLVSGELAVNITDGVLFYKDNAGVVQTLATKAATSGTYTSITLTGGTANGVAYLNGSKVVTTGSALTFDGTNLGVGQTAPAAKLDLGTTVGKDVLLVYGGGSGSQYGLGISGGLLELYTSSTGSISFNQRSGASYSELMRLTSTGLGIGTSSPGYKLHVAASASTAGYFTSTGAVTTIDLDNTNANGWGGNIAFRTGGNAAGYFGIIGSLLGNTTQDLAVYATAGNGFRVYTNGNNLRATFDASGNLGLGVTPSAWNTFTGVFEQTYGSFIAAYSNQVNYGLNAYYGSGGWTYKNSAPASRYNQASGVHSWYTAPSGTAGNAITFTQALTLDANGKLLVGLTSSTSTSADLQVNAPISLKGYTVAGLPTGTLGDIAYVTDALAPSFLATIVGGGAIKTPVFYNGTNWVAY